MEEFAALGIPESGTSVQETRSAIAVVINSAIFILTMFAARCTHRRRALAGVLVLFGWYGVMQGISALQLEVGPDFEAWFRSGASAVLLCTGTFAGVEIYRLSNSRSRRNSRHTSSVEKRPSRRRS